MKSKQIDRRIMLKGLGSVCIGLPLLEEMISPPKTQGAIKDIPIRAFNVFFGLGIPSLLQKEGYEGVLEPLKPLKNKLLIQKPKNIAQASRIEGMTPAALFLILSKVKQGQNQIKAG